MLRHAGVALCNHILWKYVRRFGYPPENARQDVADLRSLALVTVSAGDLLEPTLDWALTYGVTTYDASYAALAAQLGLPLITADISLARKLAGSDVEVRMLADLKNSLREIRYILRIRCSQLRTRIGGM